MLSAELRVGKEDMKFSCAHFIVHAGGRERLHGHNYRVEVSLRGGALHSAGEGYLIDFAAVKAAARAVCAALDERFLCPLRNPHLAVSLGSGCVILVVKRDGARFELPASDVLCLPIVNATVEELARVFAARFVLQPAIAAHVASGGGAGAGSGREGGDGSPLPLITHITVAITETPGQEARLTFDAAGLLREAEEAQKGSTAAAVE